MGCNSFKFRFSIASGNFEFGSLVWSPHYQSTANANPSFFDNKWIFNLHLNSSETFHIRQMCKKSKTMQILAQILSKLF